MIDGLRAEVDAWRAGGYAGTTATSRRLLEHWFLDQHQTPEGDPFAYFFAQREAMETTVYLHEVVQLRHATQRVARYADRPVAVADEPYPRYVVKMATGSGKTKVMTLAVAWAYFHALYEPDSDLSTTSLVVAPNLIVLERLKADLAETRAFHRDPVIPPEWRKDFDLQVVVRDEPVPYTAAGVLCLTNVHVLYDREPSPSDNPVERMLGPRPPANERQAEPVLHRLAKRGPVLVVNDEAHHLHDEVRAETGEPLKAIQSLQRLHELADGGIVAQLDFSATPRNQQGVPFPEIVVDYPLAQAITDGVVKRPVIGELSGIVEATSDDASVRYRQRIDAAIVKWREFRDRLTPAGRKPLLFVMAENTAAADQIAAYLETVADLSGKTLTIHVKMGGRERGEVSRDDLELARRAATEVDSDDNPYHAIVSVLMLREGWDVRNVVVILPLRPLTAASQILPEQTLGRGLRRMTAPGSEVEERVVVIEHEAFRDLWDHELDEAGLDIQRMSPEAIEIPQKVIAVEPGRIPDYDIEIPDLGRHLTRAARGLARLRTEDLPRRELRLPEQARDESVEYRGRDLLTGEIVERVEYPLPFANDPNAVLAWFVNEVQRQARLTGQFAVLAPLVRDYIEQRAFRGTVRLDDPRTLWVLEHAAARETILAVLSRAVDEATLEAVEDVAAGRHRRLSDVRPFLWSGETAIVERSVFGLQPCDSGLETRFCGFLDRCADVAAFAKLAPATRVSMEYRNADGRLAYYYPDFVLRLTDGSHRLVETKGLADLDVPAKDRRAAQWTSDASVVTDARWAYLRVDEDLFEQSRAASTFEELENVVWARQREKVEGSLPVPRRRSREEILELMDKVSAKMHDVDADAEIQRFRDDPRG